MSVLAPQSLSTIYRWPVVVAVVTALGLAAALSGDGVERVFSWFALAVPVVVVAASLLSPLLERKNILGRIKSEGRLPVGLSEDRK
jgi:hypothetical protein